MKANQASDTNQYGFPQFDDTASKPYTPETHLMFPTFLLYPEHNTSDYIPHFIEDTDFTSQLNAMFPTDNRPPDWDPQRRYTAKSVSVYAITTRKRLLKIGGKMTLRQVFETAGKTKDQQKDGLDVTDGCLSFTVLLKGEVEQKWIDDFKKNRDGG